MTFMFSKTIENYNVGTKNMNTQQTKVLSYIVIGMFVLAAFLPAMSADTKEDADTTRELVTLIDEGFEDGIPSDWTNTGWVLNWYGFAHTGSGWVSNSAGGSYMTTPILTFGENTELNFWYTGVDGSEAKNLEVYIDDYTDPSNLIWSDYDFTYTEYQEAIVDLSSYTGDHNITFYIPPPTPFMPVNVDDILITSEINAPPTASFTYTPSDPSTADTIDFSDDSSDVDGTVVSWSWDFGDGSTSTQENPSHSYSDDGTYTVSLTVTDNDGATDTFSDTIAVSNVAPNADFSFTPIAPEVSETVDFTDESIDDDGSIVSWSWDFGDGSTSTQENPSHSYSDYGDYNVCLTATDDDGATDTSCQTITVTTPPTASFTYTPSDPSTADTIDFSDDSSDVDGTVVSWSWDFGDGSTSTQENPSHSYSDDGTYTVSLTVTDNDGATDTSSETISVSNVGPTADFTYDPMDPPVYVTVDFSDASIDDDGSIVSWSWDFDDGNTSTLQNPSHVYNQEGEYQVVLTVTDDDGSTDTITKTVTVTPPVEVVDVNQSMFDRGFPIRHAVDGDWAGAQSFLATTNMLTKVDLYLRSFGTPEFNLTVELRENDPEGTLVESLTFTPDQVPADWEWFTVDFQNFSVDDGVQYFIVCPPAPSGVTSSFGYEWGYAFGDQYDDGSFWFTRDGGNLWRDLPTMYEFSFRTHGY